MKKQKAIKRRTCGAMAVHHRLLELDPNFRMRQTQLESATAMRMSLGVRALRAAAAPITIPVVVHVVYKTPAENISAAQIKSQIKVLNKDYRAKNADKSKVPPVWKGLVS
ncbi:MAG: zinc metalloprotease, partial [Syntrophobacteraceae bacterium]|nr:zinc metalloprotease [Syntrophobacteraceae bacterium]